MVGVITAVVVTLTVVFCRVVDDARRKNNADQQG